MEKSTCFTVFIELISCLSLEDSKEIVASMKGHTSIKRTKIVL
jgi:hypothetical protein